MSMRADVRTEEWAWNAGAWGGGGGIAELPPPPPPLAALRHPDRKPHDSDQYGSRISERRKARPSQPPPPPKRRSQLSSQLSLSSSAGSRSSGPRLLSPAEAANLPAPPMAAYQTRQELIQKLLSDQGSEARQESLDEDKEKAASKHRTWDSPSEFVRDNLAEVYAKLGSLEKQIWGKLIVMEENRRTAKAYLRHPILTLDGSDAEFDGLKLGLSRFPNPQRSEVVYDIFNEMLSGVKLKIDPDGNVWAKRLSLAPVFLKPLYRNRPDDLFVVDQKPVKVFDIRRFKEILVDELRQAEPDRARLERCCLVCLKLSVEHRELLKTPLWVVVVHLVAVELLNLVLPKDREMSSPSSSFRGGPVPEVYSRGSSGASHPEHSPMGSPTYPHPTDFLPAHRSGSGFGRADRGGVVKRMLQKPPVPLADIHLGHSSRLPGPTYGGGRSFGWGEAEGGGGGGGGGAKSLLDLRQLNQHYAPVYFAGGQGRCRDSYAPPAAFSGAFSSGLSGMGQRVLSLDALHQPPTRQDSPAQVAQAAALERKWRLRKWRSTDSGIGTGSQGSK